MSVKPYSTFRTDIPGRFVPKSVIKTCHIGHGQTRNFQPESALSTQVGYSAELSHELPSLTVIKDNNRMVETCGQPLPNFRFDQ
jgi:hypothetical protein